MDHSDNDCLVVAILSHGGLVPLLHRQTGRDHTSILTHDQSSYIHASNASYPLQNVFDFFTNDKCPTLTNKPRLFFIQACQGTNLDGGYTFPDYPPNTEIDISLFDGMEVPPPSPILPHADFLVAYSTLPGYYAFRNTVKGSWFIQALCKELKDNAAKHHLIHLLTFVIQAVAYDMESNTPDNLKLHKAKQIPWYTTMLTKLLFFQEKRSDQCNQHTVIV